MMESEITAKGRVTIPNAIRKHLGLKPGDRVKFFVYPGGGLVLMPMLSASGLRIMADARPQRAVTTDEMADAVAEGAAGTAPRASRQ